MHPNIQMPLLARLGKLQPLHRREIRFGMVESRAVNSALQKFQRLRIAVKFPESFPDPLILRTAVDLCLADRRDLPFRGNILE